MDKNQKFWDRKNLEYSKESWINKPSKFATWAVKYFPKHGKILELGAGQGQDSRYFATLGYEVVSTDFSDISLKQSKTYIPKKLANKITVARLDLKYLFPLNNSSFDIVYSHLAIHYFNANITQQIFDEIYRVLKPDGLVTILVNSTTDPEYGSGKKLEKDYFEVKPDYPKRYFNISTVKDFARDFKILLLDDRGLTYKDVFRGKSNLIRFVGKKK